jgi:sugar phosphate isomerase/epimerase
VQHQRIRIGNQTTCHDSASVPYQFALRNGFDVFEWFSDKGPSGWCEDDMSPRERDEIRRQGLAADLLFSVHAPHAADPTTRDGAAAIVRSIRFAGDVGAAVVNLHLFPTPSPGQFAEALATLLEPARQAGVRLTIENTPQTSPEDFNALFSILSRVAAAVGRVGMCLDMGHANLFAGTRNDYVGFVDRLGEHVPILHWHAHENWGDRDNHLTLFTGPAARDERGVRELARRLLQRGFCGSVILEQWPHPPELLVKARDRLRSVLDTEPRRSGLIDVT